MNKRKSASFLRVVQPTETRSVELSAKESILETNWQNLWQPSLFPEMADHLIVTVAINIKPENLTYALEHIRPAFVIDLRIVPRFDYEVLGRRVVFELFRSSGTAYFDVAGDLGVLDQRDPRLNPAFVGDYVRTRVFKCGKARGPIAFLADEAVAESDYLPLLISNVSGNDKWQWVKM